MTDADQAQPRVDFVSISGHIDRILADIAERSNRHSGWILTESDFKCVLYQQLAAIPELAGFHPLHNRQLRGAMIHTELPWLNNRGLLRFRPDLTIIEPEGLEVLSQTVFRFAQVRDRPLYEMVRESQLMQRKGFEFTGRAVNIELKFVRSSNFGKKDVIGILRGDYQKTLLLMHALRKRHAENAVLTYQIVLSRKHFPQPPQGMAPLQQEFGTTLHHQIRWLQNGQVLAWNVGND